MKRPLRGSWLILISLAIPLNSNSQQTELKIQIRVYNYARVSDETLVRAKKEAARIYERAGIATAWFICPLTEEELTRNATCEFPSGPTILTLRLLSAAMAQRIPVGSDVFGFAVMPANGGFGVLANVFADRVREIESDDQFRKVILGHLIAHELGHLLLCEAGHQAATGIMHIPWQTKELEQAKRGAMLFMASQCEKIRVQVLARMACCTSAR